MAMCKVLWVFVVILFAICCVNCKEKYVAKFLEVPLDHFSFTNNQTFKLRYLINDDSWDEEGPIFFYTGNEGDITMFAENTGFMYDIAPTFSALIIFVEHRFYGVSLPFGNESYSSPEKLGYLSSTQALADFVYVIDYLQSKRLEQNLEKSPVIAFGGSYGGMLSAWLRMKYPASVVGAIAASAPILQFKDLTPCDLFNRVATDVFKYAVRDADCSAIVTKMWPLVRNLLKTDAGRTEVANIWQLCKPLNEGDADLLVSWLYNIIINLIMVNYPYDSNFLAPLPANPVYEFCTKLAPAAQENNNTQFLTFVADALNLYTNYTGTTKCNDINETADPKLGYDGWNFQACTEMIMPMCSTDTDMFENAPWDFKSYSDYCVKSYGIAPPREDLAILEYGGKELSAASNIVFSNGLLDPWSSGGVLSNVSSTVVAVIIPEGAHHLDLRSANELDPQSVVNARKFHVKTIRSWIKNYYLAKNKYFVTFVDDVKSNTLK